MAQFIPSIQQQAFYDWLQQGSGSVILEACAGAGKSTTLVQGLPYLKGSVALGAYNRAAARDIKAKVEKANLLRPGLFVGTMHSFGYSAWRRFAPNSKLVETKLYGITDAMVLANPSVEVFVPFIHRMVSLGQNMLAGITWKISNAAAWERLADLFGATADLPDETLPTDWVPMVQEVFSTSARTCPDAITFDEMIWAPLAYNARFYKNDWVIVDECQDTNPARRELARRMLKPVTGRFVGVGDTYQSIYGFVGADSRAMELARDSFSASTMPLSVSYRCPRAVVAHASQYVPSGHIEAHPDAPEGQVLVWERPTPPASPDTLSGQGKATPPAWFEITQPMATDAVLCRYTKPLVSCAFGMIRANIPCKVEGRDIGKGLIALAQRWKTNDLPRLEEKLDQWLERELVKARAKHSDTAEQSALDRRETLQVFIDRCYALHEPTVKALVAEISALFADHVSGVTTLCTIHRSKGREWPRVFILERELFIREGTPDWQERQEQNLLYVAATRAQETLIFIQQKNQ